MMHHQAATEEAHGVLHEKCNRGGSGGVACPGRGATVAGVVQKGNGQCMQCERRVPGLSLIHI
eukprot:2218946-Lingulodinium_polyedra.AAC.1